MLPVPSAIDWQMNQYKESIHTPASASAMLINQLMANQEVDSGILLLMRKCIVKQMRSQDAVLMIMELLSISMIQLFSRNFMLPQLNGNLVMK